MTLFQSTEASLSYYPASDTLYLSYNATRLSTSFKAAYQQALDKMLQHNIGKLLLDLKRNAPPADETDQILRPLTAVLRAHRHRPLFIAAVVSETQYQFQVANILAADSATLPSAQVEFNYFTSRREATDWLSNS
ncbi:MAG: hypothetical protein H7Z21_06345 [Hymenobacter sp.]|nr:hypothetical protein [Hymenobacter sp.]